MRVMDEAARIESALSYIDCHDRDTWVRTGMALHEWDPAAGFDVWARWSQPGNWRERDGKAVWRSFRPGGGVTVGSLFAEARRGGWSAGPDSAPVRRDTAESRRRREAQVARERERREAEAAHARAEAARIVRACHLGDNGYLALKGVRERRDRQVVRHNSQLVTAPEEVFRRADGSGMVIGKRVCIPIRVGAEISSLQLIDPDGGKLFLPGGKVRGGMHLICRGGTWPEEIWLVEGLATGLTVQHALRSLPGRRSAIAVCFSAGNIPVVAERLSSLHRRARAVVIADNDESGAGERYARATGLRYWMPPVVGMDANDWHNDGNNLASELHNLRGT